MTGNIIHLIGFPGVGKLTIAKELVLQPHHVRVDAHMINNPIFSVIGADGLTPLSQGVWDSVGSIWDIVLDAMLNLAPKHFTFIMTNVLLNDAEDMDYAGRVQKVAQQRGGQYFPVLLSCDIEENKKRIVLDERAANLKCIDVNEPIRRHTGTPLASFEDNPNRLAIDTTYVLPAIAAQTILDHVEKKESLVAKIKFTRSLAPK